MNKVVIVGRLCADPDVRYQQSDNPMCIARYRLAVDRRFKKGEADFIPCVAFGKSGEFAEKYFHKGMKVGVVGRIQTGSYTRQDGVKVYTTDIIVEEQEFMESKGSQEEKPVAPSPEPATQTSEDDFMSLPEDFDGLPFN